MHRLINLLEDLRTEAPAIETSKAWKILKEVAGHSMADMLIPTIMEATKVVEWREKPCKPLAVSDEQIRLDEVYATFNDRIPAWAIAIFCKDDLKPSDMPARQVREQINAGLIERGMDKPGHE